MTPDEINALIQAPKFTTPDRPGRWEFTYLDGSTEAITVAMVELDDETFVLEPMGMDFPGMTLLDFIGLGQFTKYLGPT